MNSCSLYAYLAKWWWWKSSSLMKLTHLLCDSNNDNDNNEIEIDARIFFPRPSIAKELHFQTKPRTRWENGRKKRLCIQRIDSICVLKLEPFRIIMLKNLLIKCDKITLYSIWYVSIGRWSMWMGPSKVVCDTEKRKSRKRVKDRVEWMIGI